MNPYHPYPDARTKRHFERMASDPEYRAKVERRHRRRIAGYHRAMGRAVRRLRRIIEEKRTEREKAMLVYRETRHRLGDLYRVKSWYLFGVILLYRRYEQLTTREPLPSER